MGEALSAVGSSAFSMFVKESTFLYTGSLALHSIGMAFLVGISGALALRVLGVAARLPLAPLEGFLPFMWSGFWISAFTGVVLLVLDPSSFFTNPTFYIKLGAIGLAVVNIQALVNLVFRGGSSLDATLGLKKAKILSGRLLTVWLVAITAGRLTAYHYFVAIQSTAAVVIFAVIMLLAGYGAAHVLGWTQPSEQGV